MLNTPRKPTAHGKSKSKPVEASTDDRVTPHGGMRGQIDEAVHRQAEKGHALENTLKTPRRGDRVLIELTIMASDDTSDRPTVQEWFESARAAIEEFGALKENWDGYGAASISYAARDNAIQFVRAIETAPFTMPPPEIRPQPSGTILFEWETPQAEAYLEIGDTRYSGFVKPTEKQPTFLEGDASELILPS